MAWFILSGGGGGQNPGFSNMLGFEIVQASRKVLYSWNNSEYRIPMSDIRFALSCGFTRLATGSQCDGLHIGPARLVSCHSLYIFSSATVPSIVPVTADKLVVIFVYKTGKWLYEMPELISLINSSREKRGRWSRRATHETIYAYRIEIYSSDSTNCQVAASDCFVLNWLT